MFNVTLHVCHYFHANIDGLKESGIIRGMNYITSKDKQRSITDETQSKFIDYIN